jgi:hypothetical protein
MAVICFSLISCRVPTSVDNLTCDPPSVNNAPDRSTDLTVAVHVDGTPSMQGYVNNNSETRYSKTLKVLTEIARLDAKTVEYYRLGTKSEPISQDKYLQATEPSFYSGGSSSFPLLPVSQIETAITTPENKEQLSIIVTDLYQKNTDITTVTERIKQYYLNNPEYAIGILGIKSEFNGKIFLEDNRDTSITYQTNIKKQEEYHPFYIIFLGRYGDISHYFDRLLENSNTKNLMTEGGKVIFSPHYLIEKPLTLQTYLELSLEQDITRPVSLNDGTVAIEKADQPIDLLEIDKREQDKVELKYNVGLNYLQHGLKIAADSIKSNSDLQSFNRFEKTFKPNSSLSNNLTVDRWSIDENNLNFTLSIDSAKINPGVYLIKTDALPLQLESQPWWQEWNASSDDIWNGKGWKTYNLEKFLEQLKTITTEAMTNGEKPLSIGRFCYAIQRN